MASFASKFSVATAVGLSILFIVGLRWSWPQTGALDTGAWQNHLIGRANAEAAAQVVVATAASSNAKYQAPFGNHVAPEDRIAGMYDVFLQPGYTVAQLSKTIGRDMQAFIDYTYPPRRTRDAVYFHVKGVGDDLLAVLRADRGVKNIEWDGRLTLE
jgi:hypothetical protein